jgi:hypothetical protein
MRARFFVCSDVLIAVRDSAQGRRQSWAREWLAGLWNGRAGRLNMEVLHEFARACPGETSRQDVRNLLKWKPIGVERDTLERAWTLQEEHALEYSPALALACAEAGDCRYLLSELLPDGKFFGQVQVVNPYRHSPHEFGLEALVAS